MGGRRPRSGLFASTGERRYKALKPNSDYSSLAQPAVFDPVSTLAGVASPVYDAAGNYVVPGDERRDDARPTPPSKCVMTFKARPNRV